MREAPLDAAAEPHAARRVVHTIARDLRDGRILPGDRAALRRDAQGPVFWRIAVRYLEPAGLLGAESAPWRAENERRWAAILATLASSAEMDAADRPLGATLADVGVSEARVLRLVKAQGDRLVPVVRAVAHQLVAGGHRTDWADFADLILSDGTPWHDAVRRRLSLDYYRALDRARRASPTEEES